LMGREEIDTLSAEHRQAPHLRLLQKALAKEVTIRVHSEEELQTAEEASQILFGKGTTEVLRKMNESTLLSVFEGVPRATVSLNELQNPVEIAEFLVTLTGIFPSKGEARRTLKDNGVSVNKQKVGEATFISKDDFLQNKYILVQKGKKNYHLVVVE
jgi:tyrosyl-tRNA synthetase